MDIKEFLFRNDLSVKDFAELTGIHQVTISYLKRKVREPRLSVAMIIHDISGGQITFEDMAVETPLRKARNEKNLLPDKKE